MFWRFWDFALYGSWEALDNVKSVSRDAPTNSTPGKPHSEIVFLDFLVPQTAVFRSVLSTTSA